MVKRRCWLDKVNGEEEIVITEIIYIYRYICM